MSNILESLIVGDTTSEIVEEGLFNTSKKPGMYSGIKNIKNIYDENIRNMKYIAEAGEKISSHLYGNYDNKLPKSNPDPQKTKVDGHATSQAIKELYPELYKKEIDYRVKFCKELLNILSEAKRKFGSIPGIKFDYEITTLKENLKLQGRQKFIEFSDAYEFLLDVLPFEGPKNDPYQWASNGFHVLLYTAEIQDWANAQDHYIDPTDYNESKEYYELLNSIDIFLSNKVKKYSGIICPNEERRHIKSSIVDDYGEWDCNIGVFQIKPTKEMLDLAERCSGYKNQF